MAQRPIEPLPGSLHSQWVRCGKNWCRCALGGPLHGPYYYRFCREAGRQHKKYVPKGQVQRVRCAIQLWRELNPTMLSIEARTGEINYSYRQGLTEEMKRKARLDFKLTGIKIRLR